MARLTSLPPHRGEQAKRWYSLSRWKGPNGRRAKQLQAEPLCRMCRAEGRVTAGTVADHVIPHRGDPILFWEGELQTLCAPHHDGSKRRQEARGFVPGCDPSGRPKDAGHPWNRATTTPGGT